MAETPTAQTASLEGIEGELLRAIAKAADLGALEEVRVAALGKKGRVSELMQTLGRMAPEDRKGFGQAVNQLKDRVGEALEKKREALSRAALGVRLAAERVVQGVSSVDEACVALDRKTDEILEKRRWMMDRDGVT